MQGLSPAEYVLRAVSAVRMSDLEQALLTLPFVDALKLLEYVHAWAAEGAQVELAVRTAVLLLRMHQSQLVATPGARLPLISLHQSLRQGVQALKDTLGFNIAAFGHIQKLLRTKSTAPYEDEAAKKVQEMRAKLARGRDAAVAENRRAKQKRPKKGETKEKAQ